MNEIMSTNDMRTASVEALKTEFARALTLTSQNLVYMAAIWQELNNRGVDMSGISGSGMIEYIPLIASNKLDARLVIEYAGNKTLLTMLTKTNIETQRNIAETGKIEFVNPENMEIETLRLDSADTRKLWQVFGGEHGIRKPTEQIQLIINRNSKKQRKPRKPSLKSLSFEPGFTPNNLVMLMNTFDLSAQDVMNITETKTATSVYGWKKGDVDMPYTKWMILMDYVNKKSNSK